MIKTCGRGAQPCIKKRPLVGNSAPEHMYFDHGLGYLQFAHNKLEMLKNLKMLKILYNKTLS